LGLADAETASFLLDEEVFEAAGEREEGEGQYLALENR
jgi:hypothetical protein